jgi:hypothetical protein
MKTKIVLKYGTSIVGILLVVWGTIAYIMNLLVNFSKYGTIFANYSTWIMPLGLLIIGVVTLVVFRKFFSN